MLSTPLVALLPFSRICDMKIRNIPCLVGQITGTGPFSPRRHEGRSRDRHGTSGWNAMDAVASGGLARRATIGMAAYGEVVWSWRRDRGVYPARLCGFGNGDNQRRSPGRARISRKPLRGESRRCVGLPVDSVCSACVMLCFCARDATGAFGARLSLRPLRLRGTTRLHNSGKIAPRECLWLFLRHCERSEAIQLRSDGRRTAGLLRRYRSSQ